MTSPDQAIERRLAADLRSLAFSLRSLVRRPTIVCREHESVRAAVARMQEARIGSIVVVDGAGAPLGIFTERDMLRVALAGQLESPVGAVMSRDPLALAANTPAYEAALAMIESGFRHVLVDDSGSLIGVVSERDLFSLQRLGLGELSMEIRRAAAIETLATAAERVRRLTRLLVDQGVAAEQLTLYVSLLNDRICQRIIELVRKRFSWDGFGWCWLAFGSEGRLEQTFATDQDNGLVFEAHDGARPNQIRDRLLPFAHAVNQALDACGFPLCKGNVMASNPELCLSVAQWKAKLEGWLAVSDPKALLDAAICLDFRPLYGDARLALELRSWFLAVTRARPNFLRLLAENALQSRPPLGKWRDFVTEDTPSAPNTVNLKRDAVRPIVDCARILSLARTLEPTSTVDRLRAAGAVGAIPPAEAQATVAAFHFIQQVRLHHQAGLAAPDLLGDLANRINPDSLNELDRRTLKEAFKITRDLQARIALDYQL